MSLRRKPKRVEDFIKEGGEAPKETSEGFKNVRLRVPDELLREIEANRKLRRSGISRHAWILESIVEKLKKESD